MRAIHIRADRVRRELDMSAADLAVALQMLHSVHLLRPDLQNMRNPHVMFSV
jgi:hypothetical protein